MAETATRCGFVALVGRPNVGKSTLINTLVGEKISIVTPKPQTTRHRILGVRNEGPCQLLFVDTPGLRDGHHNAMGQTMNRNADTSMADADVTVFVTETGGLKKGDRHVLARIARHGIPCVAVLNKIDTARAKSALLPELQALSALHDFVAVVPLSARDGDNVDALLAVLVEAMPEGPWLYPAEQLSDRPAEFRMAETIREKLMMALSDEVPYGVAVEIERVSEEAERLEVDATVWVEKDSQKPIVIGSKGERLKQVGRAARLELKRSLGRPVHLTLWVKVKKNWADNERALAALGYEVGR